MDDDDKILWHVLLVCWGYIYGVRIILFSVKKYIRT